MTGRHSNAPSDGVVRSIRRFGYGLLAGLYENFALGTAPHNAAKAPPVPIG